MKIKYLKKFRKKYFLHQSDNAKLYPRYTIGDGSEETFLDGIYRIKGYRLNKIGKAELVATSNNRLLYNDFEEDASYNEIKNHFIWRAKQHCIQICLNEFFHDLISNNLFIAIGLYFRVWKREGRRERNLLKKELGYSQEMYKNRL